MLTNHRPGVPTTSAETAADRGTDPPRTVDVRGLLHPDRGGLPRTSTEVSVLTGQALGKYSPRRQYPATRSASKAPVKVDGIARSGIAVRHRRSTGEEVRLPAHRSAGVPRALPAARPDRQRDGVAA